VKRLLILAAVLVMLAPVSVSAQHHHGGGVVVVGSFIGGWYSPFWGPYWGPYVGGYWGPGYYDPYPNTGEVKIDSKVKDAQVFINDAYLGTAHDNKTIHLRPGTYKIEVRVPGREPFTQSVYVTVGKTLRLHPEG
jgi:hypothetical protein